MKSTGLFGGSTFDRLVRERDALCVALETRRKSTWLLSPGERLETAELSRRDRKRVNHPDRLYKRRLVIGPVSICEDGTVVGPPGMLAALRLYLKGGQEDERPRG